MLFHVPLPFVLLLIGLFSWSLSFTHSFTLLLRFSSLLKIAPQATSPWIPLENQSCSLNYADKVVCALLDSSPPFPYLKGHQCATKLILLVMILGCEQQKKTLANLSKKGIYWKVIVTLRIKGEAIEAGSKNGKELKKAQQARMPPGPCTRMISLGCSYEYHWRWTTCCWWYCCHHIQHDSHCILDSIITNSFYLWILREWYKNVARTCLALVM